MKKILIWFSLPVLSMLILFALPRIASAATITVPTGSDPQVNGDNFQSALNAVQCGDTIVLTAGAHYGTRIAFITSTYGPAGYPFGLPNKSCSSGQYVTIQTSAIASLPADRINPSNIGLMATLETNTTSWVIEPASGAGNYKFIGIEFTNTNSLTTNNGFNPVIINLPILAWGAWPHDMVFDRVWIHPYDDVTNPSGTTRTAAVGIFLSGANQTIENSYVSGFCCRQNNDPTGGTAQSEGITSGGPGPIIIKNNFIEAFGWNIFTGGNGAMPNPANKATISNATLISATFSQTATLRVGDWVAILVPTYIDVAGLVSYAYVVKVDTISGNTVTYRGMYPDGIQSPLPVDGSTAQWRGLQLDGVTVTNNTFSKRAEWCSGQYGISKSVWEMKDGSHVLFEGNIVDIPPHCAPINTAFTANQTGDAPWMDTSHNIFRNNIFKGLGRIVAYGSYNHANPVSTDMTFTNNLMYFDSPENFFQIGNGASWTVTHNTVRGITNSIMQSGGDGRSPVTGISFKDNILYPGPYFWNGIAADWPDRSGTNNVMILNGNVPPPNWPANAQGLFAGDFQVPNDSVVGFSNISSADSGGDYHGYALSSSSLYKGKASDGKDPGVDFAALDAALAGNTGTVPLLPPPPPTTPVCGNAVVETGESCDLGAANGLCPATCSSSCTSNICSVSPLPTTKFQIGDRAEVNTRKLNVRLVPGGKNLGFHKLGDKGTVLSGPTQANGYTWWNINYDTNPDGYSAENYLTKLTLTNSINSTTQRDNLASILTAIQEILRQVQILMGGGR